MNLVEMIALGFGIAIVVVLVVLYSPVPITLTLGQMIGARRKKVKAKQQQHLIELHQYANEVKRKGPQR